MNIYLRESSHGYLQSPSASRYRRTLNLCEAFRAVQAGSLEISPPPVGAQPAEQTLFVRVTAVILSLAFAAMLICASIAHAASM